jgi:hypothetical protein
MPSQIPGFLQTASILFGIVMALVGFLYSQRWRRRAQTVTIINSLSTAAVLDKAYCEVIRLLRKGVVFDLTTMKEEEVDDLIRVLNYYEFLCASFRDHVIDRKIVMDLAGASMVNLFMKSDPFVSQVRRVYGRANIYFNLEGFAKINAPLLSQT